MKKKLLLLCSLTLIIATNSAFSQVTDPSAIKADPDWKIIADIQDKFVNRFVTSKTDILKIDLTSETSVLNIAGMTKDEYQANVSAVRAAATRLVKKYNLDAGKCESCKTDERSKDEIFRSVINNFRDSPDLYLKFRTETMGTGKAAACCGFWFYACVSVCAATIEAFPVYLGCCTFCYRSECCK